MKTPYEFILHLYLNFNMKDAQPFLRDRKNIYRNDFNKWIKNFFNYILLYDYDEYHRIDRIILTVHKTFNSVNLSITNEDLIKLINTDETFGASVLKEFFTETNLHGFNVKEMYDIESANRIYSLYKNWFLMFNHDPFSFSNEELTNEDKMNFIHNIL